MDVGTTIKELRAKKGLTQAELAAEVGWERGTIAAVETGAAMPGRELVAAIATFFGVSVDYVLGRHTVKDDASLSEREQQVISLFRRSPEMAQESVLGILKSTARAS
jgi:transcriptional regulator with XRE-family HTH domain